MRKLWGASWGVLGLVLGDKRGLKVHLKQSKLYCWAGEGTNEDAL
jgi:hypothetical protein